MKVKVTRHLAVKDGQDGFVLRRWDEDFQVESDEEKEKLLRWIKCEQKAEKSKVKFRNAQLKTRSKKEDVVLRAAVELDNLKHRLIARYGPKGSVKKGVIEEGMSAWEMVHQIILFLLGRKSNAEKEIDQIRGGLLFQFGPNGTKSPGLLSQNHSTPGMIERLLEHCSFS